MGWSVVRSVVADPPRPDSVMLSGTPTHSAGTGSAKTKDDPASASASSGMSKLSENSSSPVALRPTSW